MFDDILFIRSARFESKGEALLVIFFVLLKKYRYNEFIFYVYETNKTYIPLYVLMIFIPYYDMNIFYLFNNDGTLMTDYLHCRFLFHISRVFNFRVLCSLRAQPWRTACEKTSQGFL